VICFVSYSRDVTLLKFAQYDLGITLNEFCGSYSEGDFWRWSLVNYNLA